MTWPSRFRTQQATGMTPLLSVDEAEALEAALIGMVDDHPINRYVLSRQLNLLGYTCVSAEDGIQALGHEHAPVQAGTY